MLSTKLKLNLTKMKLWTVKDAILLKKLCIVMLFLRTYSDLLINLICLKIFEIEVRKYIQFAIERHTMVDCELLYPMIRLKYWTTIRKKKC